MSADNGIYILTSPVTLKTNSSQKVNYEYRVAHLQAIDNIFDIGMKDISDLPLGIIFEAQYFRDCTVILDKNMAFITAGKILWEMNERSEIVEYGIQIIKRDHVFPKLPKELCEDILSF